jgi:hypothetical protein
MRNGLPWVKIPAWQQLSQPWLRNTSHADHHHAADTLARHLTAQPTEQPTEQPAEQPTLPWDNPDHAA